MELWTASKEFLESIKEYLPYTIMLLIGLPVVYWGSRKPKE
jgi:hypothetical protein